MDPLSVAVSIGSLLQLTTSIITYLGEVHSATEDRRQLLAEISSIAGSLYVLKDSAEQAKSDDQVSNVLTTLAVPSGPLEQLTATLEHLAAKLMPTDGFGRKIGKALVWPFQKAETKDILLKIERQKSLLILALQNDTHSLTLAAKDTLADIHGEVQHIGSTVDDIRRQQLDEERQKILSWFSPLSPWVRHLDVKESRQAGTGYWILESTEFRSWLEGSQQNLWCSGVPGAGKTTLMSLVIDHLHEFSISDDMVGLAFFYCSYQAPDQTAINMLSSLLRQLAEKRQSAFEHIKSLHQTHAPKDTRPLLDEITSGLREAMQQFRSVSFVIDALDECSESERKAFMGYLLSLAPKLRVLVTSRPVSSIASDLGPASCLQIEAHNKDIESFLMNQIQKAARLRNYIAAEPGLEAAIISAIIKQAKGMFLLARLHIALLSRKTSRRDVRLALESLPKELDATYDEAMARLSEQNDEDVELAMNVLFLVVSACRPLKIGQLQDALVMNHDNDQDPDESALIPEELITSVCLGLVTVQAESSAVILVHYTAEHYFKSPRRKGFLQAHQYMAQQCISCLSSKLLAYHENAFSVDGVFWPRPARTPVGYRFLGYASNYWGYHLRRVSDPKLEASAIRFLKCANEVARASGNMRLRNIMNTRQNIVPYHVVRRFNGLHIAAFFGLLEIAKVLLKDPGINVNASRSSGWTPLAIAIREGNIPLATLLAGHPKVDVKSGHLSSAGTALHLAAASPGEQIVFVRWLLERGADINSLTDRALTPLHVAAEVGHDAVVRILLEAGSNIEARTDTSTTPIYRCVRSGNISVFHTLLQHGANVNTLTWDSWTPLHEAAHLADPAMVKCIIGAGGALMVRTLAGDTALDMAERFSRHESAEIMREAIKSQSKAGSDTLPFRFPAQGGALDQNRSDGAVLETIDEALDSAR